MEKIVKTETKMRENDVLKSGKKPGGKSICKD